MLSSERQSAGPGLQSAQSIVHCEANNRMNDIMKTLTVITTLFMPVSFVASFFGMNFFQADGSLLAWTSHPAFLAMLGLTLLTPIGMLLWIRRRGWM
jgi:magnesium transporter